MEQLLDMETRMFEEQEKLRNEVLKQPTYKDKQRKLKEMLDDTFAHHMLNQSQERLRFQNEELERETIARKQN
jgi:hypothetical protein